MLDMKDIQESLSRFFIKESKIKAGNSISIQSFVFTSKAVLSAKIWKEQYVIKPSTPWKLSRNLSRNFVTTQVAREIVRCNHWSHDRLDIASVDIKSEA